MQRFCWDVVRTPDVEAAARKLAAWSECPRPGILQAKSTVVAD